jgi:hypothetical protein
MVHGWVVLACPPGCRAGAVKWLTIQQAHVPQPATRLSTDRNASILQQLMLRRAHLGLLLPLGTHLRHIQTSGKDLAVMHEVGLHGVCTDL